MQARPRRHARAVAAILVGLLTASVMAPPPPPAEGQETPDVVRREGVNRYATAAAASAGAYPDGAELVFVATGTNFPDALAAGVHAGALDAPLLLTLPDELPDATRDEIDRLDPAGAVVVGGVGSVSSSVADQLDGLVGSQGVVRVAGDDRFATAEALSTRYLESAAPVAYVASGVDFPDALVAGPAAADEDGSLLLVRQDSIPGATRRELRRLAPERIVVVGGDSAVSASVVQALRSLTAGDVVRRSGDDRYATAAEVSAVSFAPVDGVVLATGGDFPDALAGAAIAGAAGVPLLTTRPDCVPDLVVAELDRLGPDRVTVLGGVNAVSAEAADLTPCSRLPGPQGWRPDGQVSGP